jgi:hypothetical protein
LSGDVFVSAILNGLGGKRNITASQQFIRIESSSLHGQLDLASMVVNSETNSRIVKGMTRVGSFILVFIVN